MRPHRLSLELPTGERQLCLKVPVTAALMRSGTALQIELCPKPPRNFIFAVAGLPAKRLPNGTTKLTDSAGAAQSGDQVDRGSHYDRAEQVRHQPLAQRGHPDRS